MKTVRERQEFIVFATQPPLDEIERQVRPQANPPPPLALVDMGAYFRMRKLEDPY